MMKWRRSLKGQIDKTIGYAVEWQTYQSIMADIDQKRALFCLKSLPCGTYVAITWQGMLLSAQTLALR